jgi:hypothetical protein
MRGGASIHQLLHEYSSDDRDAMYIVIKENVEATKESGLNLI